MLGADFPDAPHRPRRARDLYVLKLHPSGAVARQKRYATDVDDMVHSIRQTPDGEYIVAAEEGYFPGHIGGFIEREFWVLKLDANGAIEWENRFLAPDHARAVLGRLGRYGQLTIARARQADTDAGRSIPPELVPYDPSAVPAWGTTR